MNWFEVLIVAVGVGLALLAGTGRRKNLRWYFAGVAAAFAVAEFAMLGPRWEMIPVFAAMMVSFALMSMRGSLWWKRAIAAGCTLLCVLSLAALWVLPVFRLPKPTGPNVVGTRTVYLSGDNGREVVVQVWYPAIENGERLARYARLKEVKPLFAYWSALRTNSIEDAAVHGEHLPLVVFGPRWDGRRGQDTFLSEELASHGYVVAAVDHPGNAARVEMSDGTVVQARNAGALDNVEATGAGAVEALWAKELAVWVGDDKRVLDQLEHTDWLAAHVDWNRIGALGHSFGGASSMALLGADARMKCAVNMDGWTFNGLEHRTNEPVMFLYEGVAEERKAPVGVEGELDRDDNAAVDGSLKKYGGMRAYVAGTQHLDFTDQTLVSPIQRLTYTGPIQGTRVRTILRGMAVGFFDGCLKGSGAVPEYPEVKMERYGGEGVGR